jgi:hypothetical protein
VQSVTMSDQCSQEKAIFFIDKKTICSTIDIVLPAIYTGFCSADNPYYLAICYAQICALPPGDIHVTSI